jgi:MFS family permease
MLESRAVSASNKRLTLIATILGSSIALLDSSVVSVALPSIQRSLGGGLAGQQWVTNAYLLTLGSFILLGGSLGDIFGERRVFAIGVGGFGATSLLCAAAPTIGLLVVFRALQGIAGALLTPSSLAVIVSTFPERERGPAIGTWTAWGTIAGALGPLVAGLILNVASWRWIFMINLPLVLGCLWLIAKAVRGRVAGLIATVAIGALVAAQYSASLDHRVAHQPLTPQGRATVTQAKQLTLGTWPGYRDKRQS